MPRRKDGLHLLPPAPGDLRLVQAFVNTVDFEVGTDELASPSGLAGWLTLHGLAAAGTEVDASDRERATKVRESLRALLVGGQRTAQQARATLDQAMVGALVRPRFGTGGVIAFEPAASGLDGALARLVAIAAEAQREGTWSRLKVCASSSCRAVFYDYSTNRTGKWCQRRCGNRLSAQAHRRRRQRWS